MKTETMVMIIMYALVGNMVFVPIVCFQLMLLDTNFYYRIWCMFFGFSLPASLIYMFRKLIITRSEVVKELKVQIMKDLCEMDEFEFAKLAREETAKEIFKEINNMKLGEEDLDFVLCVDTMDFIFKKIHKLEINGLCKKEKKNDN